MSFPKLPLLFVLAGASSLTAQAQTTPVPNRPDQGFTSVDAFGNMVRSHGSRLEVQNRNSAVTDNSIAANDRSRRDRNNDRNRHDTIRGGTTYFVPAPPYYPYPYPAPTYNNNYYYYPALPSTTVIGRPAFPWSRPTTITNIPLGGVYGGYPAPAYPYPTYPTPNYGYPAPGYGYPAYPGVPYPAYGTTTTIYGNAAGSIYSQSQTSGYGLSVGNGGVSIQLGNRRSSSSTTVTRR